MFTLSPLDVTAFSVTLVTLEDGAVDCVVVDVVVVMMVAVVEVELRSCHRMLLESETKDQENSQFLLKILSTSCCIKSPLYFTLISEGEE